MLPPEAVMVVELPLQMVALGVVFVMVGTALIVIATVCVRVHPFAAVPVTV